MRPGDLARPYGLSSQAIRNYEDRGIIPAADRSEGGHRRYGERHRLALAAFLALAPGIGHAPSADLVRSAHTGEIDRVLDRIDRAHGQLARDRTTLDLVAAAIDRLDRDPALIVDPTAPMPIGSVAHRVGVRPATLRAWEAAGILRPGRDPSGHRVYRADDLRDAQLAHQLRRGGYLLRQIAEVVTELREHRTRDHLERALADWRATLRRRGLALLHGSAALHALLEADGSVALECPDAHP